MAPCGAEASWPGLMLAPRRCPAHQCTARHNCSSSLSTGNHVLFAFNHSPAGAEQALAASRLGLTTHRHLPPQPLCSRELPIPCPSLEPAALGTAWNCTQLHGHTLTVTIQNVEVCIGSCPALTSLHAHCWACQQEHTNPPVASHTHTFRSICFLQVLVEHVKKGDKQN